MDTYLILVSGHGETTEEYDNFEASDDESAEAYAEKVWEDLDEKDEVPEEFHLVKLVRSFEL